MSRRARSLLAIVLGALAIVSLLIATLGVWVRSTVSDPDEMAAIAGSTLDQPEVRGDLARWIVEEVVALVDIDAFVADAVPSDLALLAPLVRATVQDQIVIQVDRLLATPEARRLIEASTRRAHDAALRLLRGEGLVDGFAVADGEVTLNTLPLLGLALERVQNLGLLASVEIPQLGLSGDPVEQIAALERATGRELPADFGQLAVYRSDAVAQGQTYVAQAQYAVAIAQRALWVSIVLTPLLAAAAVLVARSRRRALFLLGLAGAVTLVVARWAVDRAVSEAPHLVASPAQQVAVVSALTTAVSGLVRILAVLTVVSVVIAAVYLMRGGELRRDGSTAIGALLGAVLLGVMGLGLGPLVVSVAVAIVVAAGLRRVRVPRVQVTSDSSA